MHVRLLLPTLEAVLVAFQRHPHALTQLVDDDVETAYGVFGCASCLCVSALERSDELGLDRGTRVGLVEMLRVLVSPASDASSRGSARTISAEWAEGAAERLRETPVPELPAVDLGCSIRALRMDQPAPSKSELSMYTQLMRANLQAAKEAERSAKDALMSEDAGRVRQSPPASPGSNRVRKLDDDANDEDDSDADDGDDSEEEREDALARCRDALQDGVPDDMRTGSKRGGSKPSTPKRASVDLEASMKMELGLFTAGLTRVRTNPGIPLLDPPPVTKAEALARDVASYAAESLRVQSRLMRLCVQWEERAGEAALSVADSRLANGRPTSDDDDASIEVDHSALTRSALAALCAAAGPNPLVAAAAVRDAAAAAVALGVQLARYATDDPRSAASRARAAGEHARALRTYVGGALRRHPAALANVRACLAAAFLRLPLARVPPLVQISGQRPATTNASASRTGPECLLDHEGQPWDPTGHALAASPRIRDAAPWWLAGLGVGLGFLEDVVGAGSIHRDGGSFGLGGIALPPGAPAAVGAAAAGAAADLGKPRKPEDIVAAVLPPTAGTLDALIGATLVSLSLSAISPEGGFSDRGFSVKDARRLAARLATHALASLRVHRAPLAARHCDAIAAALAMTDDARAADGSIDGGRAAEAVKSLADAVLGESTPLGPALAKALIPREARCEFAIKVIVHAAAPPAGLLAVAAGWAVASLDEDAASRLWERGFGSVAGAGWINDGSPSPGMRTTVPLPGRGWYRDAAEGVGPTDDGAAGDPRVKPRLELCLLAFHRMGRRKRMAALADALETVAGSIPGGGATSRVARSHAAFLCAHCVRNFRETPRWLVARVQRTMRGEDEKKPNANAARGVDALLEVPSSIPGAAAAVHENSGTSRRGRGRGRRLELGAETIAAVREAALVLAEAPVEPEDRLTVRPSGPGPGRRVGAYAKRAAWELLVALQDEGFDEGTAGVKGEPGTLGFLWSCSRACRAVLDDANDDSSSSSRRSVPPQLVEATVAVSKSLARGVGEDEETTRAAMTCAAADAACRAASLRATRLMISNHFDSPDGVVARPEAAAVAASGRATTPSGESK